MTRDSENIRYSQSGLWIQQKNENYVLGLSAKGQDDVGEVIFAQLNPFSDNIEKNDVIIGVEGAKSVTDLTSPLSGKVIAVHSEVEDAPELLNSKDSSDNWLLKLTEVDEKEFMEIPGEMEAIEADEE